MSLFGGAEHQRLIDTAKNRWSLIGYESYLGLTCEVAALHFLPAGALPGVVERSSRGT